MLMVVSSCLKYRHFAIFRLKKMLKERKTKESKELCLEADVLLFRPRFWKKSY